MQPDIAGAGQPRLDTKEDKPAEEHGGVNMKQQRYCGHPARAHECCGRKAANHDSRENQPHGQEKSAVHFLLLLHVCPLEF